MAGPPSASRASPPWSSPRSCGRARSSPTDPAVTRALTYLEGFIGPERRRLRVGHANYATSIALIAFQEANRKGQYDRTIKAGQDFLKTMQWDESERQESRRRVLRRRGLRRQQQPARPVEHGLLHRGPPRHRPARRRPEPQEGPGLRLAVPEPQGRVQRPGLGGEGQRRRLHLHAGEGRREHGRQDGRRRAPLVRQHDLRRAQEHDLRRPRPERPPGQGRADLHHQALHARREPRPGPAGPVLLLPHLRQDDGRARRADPGRTPRASSHDWKAELVAALAKRQEPNGGWVNPADRFMEGDPNLVTAYALLALAYTRKK